jgi:hypothetical protein
MAEPVLKSEQEVLARFHELRQSVSTLFSKLSNIETGVCVFYRLLETSHMNLVELACFFRVGFMWSWCWSPCLSAVHQQCRCSPQQFRRLCVWHDCSMNA